MARSPHNNGLAFPTEVARYLCVEPADVKRMIKYDRMPSLTIAMQTRAVTRIPLRDFHEWLVKRAKEPVPRLADYDSFMEDFNETGREAA